MGRQGRVPCIPSALWSSVLIRLPALPEACLREKEVTGLRRGRPCLLCPVLPLQQRASKSIHAGPHALSSLTQTRDLQTGHHAGCWVLGKRGDERDEVAAASL